MNQLKCRDQLHNSRQGGFEFHIGRYWLAVALGHLAGNDQFLMGKAAAKLLKEPVKIEIGTSSGKVNK